MKSNDTTGAPLIGEFKGPQGNTSRNVSIPDVSTEAKKEGSEKVVSAEEEGRQKTKAEQYQEGLKVEGISVEDARIILDKVLFEGSYSESFKIGGRMPVTLRTRMYKDSQRILRYLESEAPTTPMHVSDLVARFNVAASIQKYGDTVFTFPVESDSVKPMDVENAFHERLDFLMNLPVQIVNILINLTGKFDQKIQAVFAEGAPEDF